MRIQAIVLQWIYGVSIDLNTGIFTGKAWAENVGWIVFDYSTSNTHGVKAFWGSCAGDFDGDGDIDGADLKAFISFYNNGNLNTDDLAVFVTYYGLTDCASYVAVESTSLQNSFFSNSTSIASLSGTVVSSSINETPATSSLSGETNEDNSPDQTNNEQETWLESLRINEISWASSNGESGFATGDWEWQIDEISIDAGVNIVKLVVKDALGNIAKKEIKVVYNKILTEDETRLQEQWTRSLTYEFNFDETDSENTPMTAAAITIWLWPDKIIMTDDHLNSVNIDSDRITTEDGFQYHWNMECDNSNKNILYLDIPSDEL